MYERKPLSDPSVPGGLRQRSFRRLMSPLCLLLVLLGSIARRGKAAACPPGVKQQHVPREPCMSPGNPACPPGTQHVPPGTLHVCPLKGDGGLPWTPPYPPKSLVPLSRVSPPCAL